MIFLMTESPAHNWDDEIVAQIGKVGGEYCCKMVIPSKNFIQGFLLKEADLLGIGSVAHAEFTTVKG